MAACARSGSSLILGAAEEPREPLLVHPFRRGKVQDAADDLEAMIDRPRGLTLAPAVLDPGLQRPEMQAIQIGSRPIHGISNLSCRMSSSRLRLCWFSSTNLAAASSKVRDGRTP